MSTARMSSQVRPEGLDPGFVEASIHFGGREFALRPRRSRPPNFDHPHRPAQLPATRKTGVKSGAFAPLSKRCVFGLRRGALRRHGIVGDPGKTLVMPERDKAHGALAVLDDRQPADPRTVDYPVSARVERLDAVIDRPVDEEHHVGVLLDKPPTPGGRPK